MMMACRWNLDSAVMAFAGFVILLSVSLLSVSLAHVVSPWWCLLAVFAGLNMLQDSITGFCPAAMVFKKLGVPSGCAFK